MKNKEFAVLALTILSFFNSQLATAHAQGTAFTYQERLINGVNPANGSYDVAFTIYAGNVGGSGGSALMTLDSAGNLRTVTGTLSMLSDRNAKTNFEPVNARAVPERVAALPLTRWNFKNAPAGQRHIGPMAQDFYAAFDVGLEETGICTVDADSVALAAIQGLNQKLEETHAENAELKRQLTELKQLVQTLVPKH